MNAGIEPGSGALVERIKGVILKPAEEWPRIGAEAKSEGDILRGYVLPLAAIDPVASFIGGQVFGYGAFGFSYRPPLVGGIVTALISYVMAIVSVYVLMFIANALAPKFDGQQDRAAAFRLVAYSYTAGWLVGIFSLVPMLGFFGLLGLYSIYLLYTGAMPMMKVPEAKAAGYTAVTIACAILLMLVVAPITAAITGLVGFGAATMSSSEDAGGTVTLPGGKEMDLGKVEEMTKQMENAADGKSPPVDTAKLQELLPASVGAFQRTSSKTMAMGAMGATAEGTYTAGEKSFRLRVSDMQALGAIAGLGAAMGVAQSSESAEGYERTATVDGQMQTESWNRTSNSGKFGRMVANRFMVEAEGNADSIDQLKAAVAEIDPDDLTDLVD